MKRVLKGGEPKELTDFKSAVPFGTWDEMRDDPHNGGKEAYQSCRAKTIDDQNGLCAFCEIDIRDGNPLKARVEHFHPKSDRRSRHNWALDWNNMLAVCNGGCNPHVKASGYYLAPTDVNLSCDAHKDRMVQIGKLTEKCEGWIIDPIHVEPFSPLFQLDKGTGQLRPDSNGCAAIASWPGNKHESVEDLVQHTIEMLNLNCDRLTQARLHIIWHIERDKKRQRESGFTPQEGLANLARRYFQRNWPAFFTTIRLCLGQGAEEHLVGIQYQG